MAHYKRKYAKVNARHSRKTKNSVRVFKKRHPHLAYLANYIWIGNWPKWWDVIKHSRPSRRKDKILKFRILKGLNKGEELGGISRKPHIYYW